MNLDQLGPYRCDYTPNGRHLILAGRRGHIATLDWQSGTKKLITEIQVRETVRDVKWLHNNQYFATAQKNYVFVYDANGTEIHRLKDHKEVQRLEFLRYHFLLATVVSGVLCCVVLWDKECYERVQKGQHRTWDRVKECIGDQLGDER